MFRSRSSKTEALRYYLYISDAKLDMLFDQIDPRALKRITAEVKVDLKLASITLRGADSPGPTRSAKLRVVERFIEKHHHVGTIQQPGSSYFRGEMEMVWGWTGDNQDGVWFQGHNLASAQYVGFGGSRYHVLGEKPQAEWMPSTSRPAIQRALDQSGFFNSDELRHSEAVGELPKLWTWCVGKGLDERLPYSLPAQRLSFLAVPLAETTVDLDEASPVHVVIGTPLYVASAAA